MKSTYLDPLIPLHETREETLTRLSADIGTLTGLMNDAERMSHAALAAMFERVRNAKVEQAEAAIKQKIAGGAESAQERRFLLVREAASAGVARSISRRGPACPLARLTLQP